MQTEASGVQVFS